MRPCAAVLLILLVKQCFVCTLQGISHCPSLRLPNGRVRARAKARLVRFICNEGYTLVGNKYATCERGKWDTPTPVCVNAACSLPPQPDHGMVVSKYNSAILIYFCEPGYQLIGSSEIYCDGKQWNGSTPLCRDTTVATPTQCDFEKPDLCWWEQDPEHDFDWRRHNFETPSSHIGTGPTHDHTLGRGYDGYYLYIEASGRLINDTARIRSPLYNSSLTESGCFSFWYHMYGATIGSLRVYFNREGSSEPQLMFSKDGNQGNQWLHGIFDLPKSNRDFQIIIEGVRGSSYVSDIAIDDVAILQGDKCTANKTETTPVTQSNDDQIEVVYAQQTCRDRCTSNTTGAVTAWPSGSFSSSELCICTIDCAEFSICCPDFANYCVLGLTDEPTETTLASIATITVKPAGITGKSLPGRNESYPGTDVVTAKPDYPNGNGISINPKDDIDPAMSKPTTSISKKSSVTNKPITITTTTKGFTKSVKTTTISTTKIYTKETPFALPTTTTTTKKDVPQQSGPSTTVQQPEKLHRSTGDLDIASIVAGVAGIVVGISAIALIATVIIRRRKNYKRGTNGTALSEDSDVRFLTSDEVLDFTLARPSDNDES